MKAKGICENCTSLALMHAVLREMNERGLSPILAMTNVVEAFENVFELDVEANLYTREG